ncbi:unnamed protein product [Schistosoma curassoni]|uniref:Protein kinase domain-containing protein n=1 Tax=Schistosoma curassoni TaxID=6186 RepID=A0A183KTW4_9TREM|nr:unnamed protein product [Schistosoma curassoni]
MYFNGRYAALALPIRAFISASDRQCSSMMLPRYVKVLTSSEASLSSMIRLLHAVLYERILPYPLCILRPTSAETAAYWPSSPESVVACAIEKNRRSLDQLLINVDKTATDLLYKMLHFNPHKRITALEALKHPYVRRFYSPNEIMIMNHHVTPPLDDNIQLTVSEYRDRLYQVSDIQKILM